jgi:hypothetical protein
MCIWLYNICPIVHTGHTKEGSLMMTYIHQNMYEPQFINKLSAQCICWLVVYTELKMHGIQFKIKNTYKYQTINSMLIKCEPHFKCFVTGTILTCGTPVKPWWRAERQNQAKRGSGTVSQCEFHLS